MFKIFMDKILGKTSNSNQIYNLSKSLDKNITMFKEILNEDDTVIYRRFESKAKNSVKFCLFFDKNLAKVSTINDYIIKPITQKELSKDMSPKKTIDLLLSKTIVTCDNRITSNMDEIIGYLLYGNTIL